MNQHIDRLLVIEGDACELLALMMAQARQHQRSLGDCRCSDRAAQRHSERDGGGV